MSHRQAAELDLSSCPFMLSLRPPGVHSNSAPGPPPHLGSSLSKPPGNGDGSHATARVAGRGARKGGCL